MDNWEERIYRVSFDQSSSDTRDIISFLLSLFPMLIL
jgi:hypothetical protein